MELFFEAFAKGFFMLWFFAKVGVVTFIGTFVLYLFCPPFEKFYNNLRRGQFSCR